uniref:RGS domain-containing protein n=1 Tax=Schistosoma mansoni TaxID=6183 RepID=A0A5K4F0B8_SCHMA
MADNLDQKEVTSNSENINTQSNISSDLNTLDQGDSQRTDHNSFDKDVMKDNSVALVENVMSRSEEIETHIDVNYGDEMDYGDDADPTDGNNEDDDNDDSDSSSSGSSVARLVQTARNLVQVEKAEQIAQETSEHLTLADSQLTDEEDQHHSVELSKSDTDTDQSPNVFNKPTINSLPVLIDPNGAIKSMKISAKAAATLGIDLSEKTDGLLTVPYQVETGQRFKNKHKDYFKKKIDKEFVGQLQRANKYEGTPRESIHESLERLPMFDNESKKSTSSQQYRNEKSDGSSRNSFSPADFISTSPRHSTTIGSIGGKKNKIGFQFFRPKTSVQPGAKLVQVKELKRMIRAGKPSYEQIHNWGHSFEALLNDKYGLALFKDFLSTEFSDENIEFWIACQDYKHTTNPKKLAIKANQIFTEFIAVQANREVNLDSKTRLQTEADLSNPTVNTLENAQKRIQALMEKDSYRRFLRSEVYLTMLKEARETAKAAATAALAASLQEASDELDEPVFQLVHSTTYTSPFSFLSTFSSTFSAQNTPSLTLPGVAAAAAKADAGLNNIQDLQLLGLSTSRHMRENKQNHSIANRFITNTNTSTNLTTTSSIASSPNEIISESIQSNITCCETGYTSTTITTHTTISSHTYSTHNVTDSNDICDITNNVNTYLNTEMSNSTK